MYWPGMPGPWYGHGMPCPYSSLTWYWISILNVYSGRVIPLRNCGNWACFKLFMEMSCKFLVARLLASMICEAFRVPSEASTKVRYTVPASILLKFAYTFSSMRLRTSSLYDAYAGLLIFSDFMRVMDTRYEAC